MLIYMARICDTKMLINITVIVFTCMFHMLILYSAMEYFCKQN